MISKFPKYSVLTLHISNVNINELDLKKQIYTIKVKAMVPTATGDIVSADKEYYFILNNEPTVELIYGSSLTLQEKILKPMSSIDYNSVYYSLSSNSDKSVVFELLKYLGLKFPKRINSLNSFKKYLNKNYKQKVSK